MICLQLNHLPQRTRTFGAGVFKFAIWKYYMQTIISSPLCPAWVVLGLISKAIYIRATQRVWIPAIEIAKNREWTEPKIQALKKGITSCIWRHIIYFKMFIDVKGFNNIKRLHRQDEVCPPLPLPRNVVQSTPDKDRSLTPASASSATSSSEGKTNAAQKVGPWSSLAEGVEASYLLNCQ